MTSVPDCRPARLGPVLVYCVLAAVGCENRTVPPEFQPQTELLVASGAQRDLDMLFVIDNDATMARWQTVLGDQFSMMITGLDTEVNGRPNVHIGVVTTDVGTGAFPSSGCTENGDDGMLMPIDDSLCTDPDPVSGHCMFVEDIEDENCEETDPSLCRITNFDQSAGINGAFATAAIPGIAGCRFEQPLEAMRRALDGRNGDFRRPEAGLAVIFVTDGDDCSAFDSSMFDSSQTDPDGPLGPFSRFRCFEFGVECVPDDPRASGVKDSCKSREDSMYMTDVQEYVDFLQGLGGRDQPVVVSVLGGDPTPVEVEEAPDGAPGLTFPCVQPDPDTGEDQMAGPAIRLSDFASRFEDFGAFTSLCDADVTETLINMATKVNESLRGTCLNGDLFDTNDVTTDVEPGCLVIESKDGQDDPTPILECESEESVRPCFVIESDPRRCAGTPTELKLVIERDAPASPGSVVAMACDIRQETAGFQKNSYYYDCSISLGGRGPLLPAVCMFGLFGLFGLALRRRTR